MRNSTMTRRTFTTILCLTGLSTAVTADVKGDGPFDGEWQTTISLVKLQQTGNAVTGSFGVNGQFPLKGSVKDNTLTFEYEEGQANGDGQFTLDASGHAFEKYYASPLYRSVKRWLEERK